MATLKISVLLASGARVGSGKTMPLESIRDTGSISGAARSMGMDCRRAWLLLDSMNQAFDTPVVAMPGGLPDAKRPIEGNIPATIVDHLIRQLAAAHAV